MATRAPGQLTIRNAKQIDAALLVDLIGELAREEALPHAVVVTAERLCDALFGARPAAEAVILDVASAPSGFAIFYETFSSTLGLRGLHLDDLYLRPSARGNGYGGQAMQYLARVAIERGCGRFEWWALKSNDRARGFYEQLGAQRMTELDVFRLTGVALEQLARHGFRES